ncbi:hypothetical protein OUZ56_004238 [Daphnia magna]|uniref:Uncharacterized protein n=1 Tax=Daphnia magna TaxID=35525 RepID=A0ABQ9YPD0_9CRUS|nr:hypothetical protein OUZ56_004238 [Daphnia magna]
MKHCETLWLVVRRHLPRYVLERTAGESQDDWTTRPHIRRKENCLMCCTVEEVSRREASVYHIYSSPA